MSKTSHLSIISPLDNKATLKIHQKIFRYLWRDQESDYITRKTNFFFFKKKKKRKNSGVLNLLEP